MGRRRGPLFIPKLADLPGGHVATITCDTFEGFPLYSGKRDALHPDLDRLLFAEAGVESGRVAVYVNGEKPEFETPAERIAFTMTINNAKLARPIFVGVAPWGQAPLGDGQTVVAIAGFQPDGTGDELLFLRGL